MEEKGKMGNSDAILSTRLQMLGARRGCEMGEFHCSYVWLRNETPKPPFI
jgi:hypothetical protein